MPDVSDSITYLTNYATPGAPYPNVVLPKGFDAGSPLIGTMRISRTLSGTIRTSRTLSADDVRVERTLTASIRVSHVDGTKDWRNR